MSDARVAVRPYIIGPTATGFVVPTVTYDGPGDAVSGAGAWWGLRAYSQAQCTGSAPAIDISDAANAHTTTINILSTGYLDVAAVASWIASFGSTALCTKVYDQSGNGNHMVTPWFAPPPTLVLNGFGSLPVMRFTLAAGTYSSMGSVFSQGIPAVQQPFNDAMVAKRTANFTTNSNYIDCPSVDVFTDTSINNFAVSAGIPTASVTASDNVMHSFVINYNTTSSVIAVDGADNSVTLGTGYDQNFTLGSGDVDIMEWGRWFGLVFSGAQRTALYNNAHSRLGV